MTTCDACWSRRSSDRQSRVTRCRSQFPGWRSTPTSRRAPSLGRRRATTEQLAIPATARLVSGTRSETACRCRTAPAGHRGTRHASGSPNSAQGEHLPPSHAGAVHAQVLGHALGRPLAGTRHDRSRPAWGCRAAAARGVRRRRVGSARADEATHDGRRPEMPTNVGVLSRAEHDPLNIGRSRASGCLELGGGRRAGQGRQPANQQDEGDRRYAHKRRG
jgi:hypothetical protein